MRILHSMEEFDGAGCVVALGTFDGVHLGHARLIEEAVSLARAYGLPAAALTFDRHPLALIRPDAVPLTGDTKVLCSAGGSEDSWYWRSGDTGTLHGAGYFTSILTRGCDPGAAFPADEDEDGENGKGQAETGAVTA